MPVKRRISKLVALDWDVRTLRIVHAIVGKRGIKIDRLLSARIPSEVEVSVPQQMGAYIRKVCQHEGISTRHALVDVPRDQAILKTLRLPAIRREDLPGLVEIQIAKELPFPASEAVIDFVAGSYAEADTASVDVLVAAVRRELLHQYEDTIAQAGLRLVRIGLRPHAHKLAVGGLLRHAMPERVLLIDVRPTLTEIDVFRNGALVFSRAASILIPESVAPASSEAPVLSLMAPPPPEEGSREPGEEISIRASAGLQGVISSLLLEMTRSIEAYRVSDAAAQVDHVVISGDLGVEETLGEAIQQRHGVTTELYNPASTFGWDAEEGAAAPAFAAALGLVLGQSEAAGESFDFLHPKKMISVTQQRLRKAPYAIAAAVLLALSPFILLERMTHDERAELARVDKAIKAISETRDDDKKFLDFAAEIRTFDQEQHVWVDVLHELLSALPSNEEVVLTGLELRQGDDLVLIKTKALELDTGTKVVRSLEEFRRDGSDRPRFKVSMGPQSQKKNEKYPYWQDFRIRVLDDGRSNNLGAGAGRDRRERGDVARTTSWRPEVAPSMDPAAMDGAGVAGQWLSER